MLVWLLLTIAVFATVMLIMSVGVLLNGRCLRGSCGGPDVIGPDGQSLLCATCPKRKERHQVTARTIVSPGGS